MLPLVSEHIIFLEKRATKDRVLILLDLAI